MNSSNSSWIFSARFDSCFILAPAILVSMIAVAFSDQMSQLEEMPSWLWLVLIVGIDAGHVYSTLFRTYLVRNELQHRQALLTLTPIIAWITGSFLYSIDDLLFWRVLAYLALFHFIRQQYGFMMIYSRNERNLPGYYKQIDKAAIYLATLYPIMYWHCHHRNFDWFIEGDFLEISFPQLSEMAAWFYLAVLFLYLFKEINLYRQENFLNIPKNLTLIGTACSWYIGIVAFNNDLIFTACNVIAHGVPYYALIWFYGYKQVRMEKGRDAVYLFPWFKRLFNRNSALIYIGFLVTIAFVEEGLWDGLIWQEHYRIFSLFSVLPVIGSPHTLSWLIPLLALPQTVHYLLDAYMWRLHRADTNWKKIMFHDVHD